MLAFTTIELYGEVFFKSPCCKFGKGFIRHTKLFTKIVLNENRQCISGHPFHIACSNQMRDSSKLSSRGDLQCLKSEKYEGTLTFAGLKS